MAPNRIQGGSLESRRRRRQGSTCAGRLREESRLFATAIALLAAGCGSIDEGGGGVKADQNAGGTVGKGRTAKKGGELTVGLAEDPDQLDPTLARTFVGPDRVREHVREALRPRRRSSRSSRSSPPALPEISGDGKTVTIKLRDGIKFNDGTTFDAAAVKTSLDRHRSLEESGRASRARAGQLGQGRRPEHGRDQAVDAVRAADRAARRPRRHGDVAEALKKLGEKFATNPVCVGPFKYASRSEGDSIVLERAPDYYDASKVKLDKLTFKIIVESSARASNLRSGDVDVIDRLEPTDLPTIKKDSKLQTLAVTSLGYQGLTVNVGNKNGLGKPPGKVNTPLASQPKLREAFDAAHRPQGHREDRLRRRGRAGVQPDLAGQPAARREPRVPGARRRQGQEARARRAAPRRRCR